MEDELEGKVLHKIYIGKVAILISFIFLVYQFLFGCSSCLAESLAV